MDYYELLFTTHPTEDYQQDLLIDALAGIGFDTFEELEGGFKAYIPEGDFDKDVLEENLAPYHDMFSFSYEVNVIQQKNWNEVWESNFEPIQIRNRVYVRATFHQPKPEFPLEIVIDPKSLPYLDGTELDFAREGLNEGFKFNNPNVKDECGCGESFNV